MVVVEVEPAADLVVIVMRSNKKEGQRLSSTVANKTFCALLWARFPIDLIINRYSEWATFLLQVARSRFPLDSLTKLYQE